MDGRYRFALGGCILLFILLAQTVNVKSKPFISGSNPIQRITTGENGNGGGSYAAISASGRYVAFESAASDIAPGAISGSWDVYIHDSQTGLFERESTRSSGSVEYNPGDYTSPPSVSADGVSVAFLSRAENLVDIDHNFLPDVFVHNRVTGATSLVSISMTGKSGNDASYTPAVSADGRYIVFQSFASDLVAGDTNNSMDVFIRDMLAGVTERVSVADNGAQGFDSHDYGFPGLAVSADGRYVAFAYDSLPAVASPATAGPNIYLRDRVNKTTRWVSTGTLPALSADGRFLAFATSAALVPGDTNNGPDIYVLDRIANQFEQVSVPSTGSAGAGAEAAFIQSPPSLSADGRFVAFETTTSLVSADANSFSDIYLRDRKVGVTSLISISPGGSAGNGESHFPALAADSAPSAAANAVTIAFTSLASNLVLDDTNGQNDVFVYRYALPAGQVSGYHFYLPVVHSYQ